MATYKTLINLTQRNLPAFPYERRRTRMFSNAPGDTIQPYIYWMENVIPTVKGVKSVAWLDGPVVAEEHYSGLPATLYKFPTETKGTLQGIFSGDKLKYYTPENSTWHDIYTLTKPSRLPTVAHIQNRSYIFAHGDKLKVLNDLSLADVTLKWGTSVPEPTDLIGISGVQGYLVMYSNQRVYWSSPLDPTEFEISDSNGVSTGAGSTQVQGLTGSIVSIVPIPGGAIIYTNTMAFSMRYTGNALVPWAFNQIPMAGGIVRQWHVAGEMDSEIHYVWTVAGLQKISITKADDFEPEFTEMFARDAMYVFNRSTMRMEADVGSTDVRLELIGSSVLAISRGKLNFPFSECWIYNLDLNRWGRTVLTHWQIGNKIPLVDISKPTWKDLIDRGSTLKSLKNVTYTSLLGDVLYSSERPLEVMALGDSGNLLYSDWAEMSVGADAYVLAGDFRISSSGYNEVINVKVNWMTYNDNAQIVGINEHLQETLYIPSPWDSSEFLGRTLGEVVTLGVQGDFELTDLEVEAQRI